MASGKTGEKQGFMLCLACLTFVEGTSGLGQMPLYFLVCPLVLVAPCFLPKCAVFSLETAGKRMLRSPSLEPQFTPVASHGDSCLVELDLPFGK